MPRPCAYCGRERDLTREHVWPRCVHDRLPTYDQVVVTDRPTFTSAGGLTVRDVCAECNNARLSPLDAYWCGLYDRHFSRYLRPGNRVRFEYDSGLLSRSLLKLLYNGDRASGGGHRTRLQPYAGYVLGDAPRPPNLHVFLSAVTPSPVDPAAAPPDVPVHVVDAGHWLPTFFSQRRIELHDGAEHVLAYVLLVHSYLFHVFLMEGKTTQDKAIEAEFLQAMAAHPRLRPDRDHVVFTAASFPNTAYVVGQYRLFSNEESIDGGATDAPS